jgi:predicted MFS family arabinose efflux permease
VSFVNEAFRPANSTAIAFYSKPENRTRSYALNRLAINAGWAVGSAMGGFIISKLGYQALFWVDGITNITAAVVMFFFLKPVDYKPSHQKGNSDAPKLSARKDKTYMLFIAVSFLFAACFFQLFTNIPIYFNRELHLSESYIGILMALNGVIIALIEMVLVYKLEGKGRNTFLITMGVALVGTSFLSLTTPFAGAALALLMIVVVTFGEIFSMPFMNTYWISRTVPSNRGEYAALYTMAWSAAQCVGPVLGARIADHDGFRVLWWGVGGVSLVASLFFYLILNGEKKRQKPEPDTQPAFMKTENPELKT